MSTDNPPRPVRIAAHEPPLGWKLVERRLDGEMYVHRHSTLIVSVNVERDGHWWMHMSLARKDRLPTWAELMEAKDWALGSAVYAYAVAPPRDMYVNIHAFALHLWRRLDGGAGQVLPEFSGVVDGVRSI